MKRFIDQKLLQWKASKRRKPLILKGARQVGKTHSLKKLGESFASVTFVDLERNPAWHGIFKKDLSAKRICADLEVLTGKKIVPGQTLLVFDEIQACPKAVAALRYFFEEMPQLHVAAAGSLLEFAMRNISFPVGRIQFLHMQPLCFAEYLQAIGNQEAAELIMKPPGPVSPAVHDYLIEELRRYFFVGGMPECVQVYVDTASLQAPFEVQAEIVETYRLDFAKYRPQVDTFCLNEVLSSVAQGVGQQIKYAHLGGNFANATLKKAFDLLCLARIIKKIPSVDPSGLPLRATASAKIFKAVLLDIGLMRYLSGMPAEVEYRKKDLLDIYRGGLAEQFVGQEMVLSQQDQLYYWSRRAKSSTAEVDFIATRGEVLYPIEVKSGVAGSLKSLHIFLQTYEKVPHGIVLSERPYSVMPEQKLVFVPIYFTLSATGGSTSEQWQE